MINRREFLESLGLTGIAMVVSELAIDNTKKEKPEEEIPGNVPNLRQKRREYDELTKTLTIYDFPLKACRLKITKTRPGYIFDTIYSKTESKFLKGEYDSGIRIKGNYPFKGCRTNLQHDGDRLIPLTIYPDPMIWELIKDYEQYVKRRNQPFKRQENSLVA